MSYSHSRADRVLRWSAPLALAIGLTVPMVGPGDVSAQETLPDIAHAVPGSAVVFHWTDLDQDGKQWQQAEELFRRVGVPDALDLWQEAVLMDAEPSGGITSGDLDALLGGEMAFVVLPEAVEHVVALAMAGMASDTAVHSQSATPMAEMDVDPRGIVAILKPSDIDAAWSYAERQIADAAAEMGTAIESSAIGSADVLVVPPVEAAPGLKSDQDSDADWKHGMDAYGMHGYSGFAAARAGEFIVAGHSEADLKEVIDVIDGSADSMASSAEAVAVAAELPAESLTFTYIDGQGILDVLGPEAIAMVQSAMPETPIDMLASQSGLSISADEPGFRFDTATILNADVNLDAFTVSNDPSVSAAAERAPADSFVFQAGRLPANAFDGSAFALAQFVNAAESGESWQTGNDAGDMFPTEEEMTAEIAAASATLGFDLQTELFDLLGDQFIAFSTFPSITLDSFGIDAAVAVAATDPEGIAETMVKIAAWIDRSEFGVDITTRPLDGSSLFVAASEEMEGTPGFEFGMVDGQAVAAFGSGADALTTAPAKSLADDEQYQTVMALLPAAYYQVGYVDIGNAIDRVFNLVGLFTAFSERGAEAIAAPADQGESVRNIRALGAVAFQEGYVSGASAILYVSE